MSLELLLAHAFQQELMWEFVLFSFFWGFLDPSFIFTERTRPCWSVEVWSHDLAKGPLVSWNFLNDYDVTNFQISLWLKLFLSRIEVDEVLLSAPTPKLFCQKLDLLPLFSGVNFFLDEISWWCKKCLVLHMVSRWFGVRGSKLFGSFRH